MRHVIWNKDDYFPYYPPLYMDAETITISYKEIPMLDEGFDLEDEQLAVIKNIETVDGEMTCEIDWFENASSVEAEALFESGEARLVGRFFDTKIEGDVVTKAALRYVSWAYVEGLYPSDPDNSEKPNAG